MTIKLTRVKTDDTNVAIQSVFGARIIRTTSNWSYSICSIHPCSVVASRSESLLNSSSFQTKYSTEGFGENRIDGQTKTAENEEESKDLEDNEQQLLEVKININLTIGLVATK